MRERGCLDRPSAGADGFRPRRWAVAAAALVLVAGCVDSPVEPVGPGAGPDAAEPLTQPAAAPTVYGHWEAGGSEPVFRYTGPTTSPQREADGSVSTPRHLFGNDAWTAIADVAGGLRFFVRLAGPLLIGDAAGSLRGELVCGGESYPVDRSAAADPGPLRLAGRWIEAVAEAGPYWVRQRVVFAPGTAFAVTRTVAVTGPTESDCAWRGQWDLTPVPLLPEPLASPAALTDIHANRLEHNENYTFSLTREAPGRVALAVAGGPGAVAPPAGFGPYPRRFVLGRAGGGELAVERDGVAAAAAGEPLDPPLVLHTRIPIDPGGSPVAVSLTVAPPPGIEPPPAAVPAHADGAVALTGPGIPAWFNREWDWHGRALAAFAAYDGAYGETFVDQGSAYLFVQGLSGAVRDFTLHAMGLIPVRPDLAKANLRVAMKWTESDGHIFYGGGGFGGLSDVGIRNESTDLDLFLLWALSRYLGLTRDTAFLDETVPFADGGSSTVQARMALAARHLMDRTGTGANGWLRVGSGDWSDGILLFSPDADLTKRKGESFFNTALALVVLPRVEPWLRRFDPELADRVAAFTAALRSAAAAGWREQWYVRGSFGNGDFLGEERLFLESNQLALLAELGDEARRRTLQAAMVERLDAPEPLGARIVDPPSRAAGTFLVPGWDVNGGTWPAMQGILVPAYARLDPDRAWRALQETALEQHARTYPAIWYGIWTGPDSYNASNARRPGHTFHHLATPMISFPAANMNAHSGPLMALDLLVGLVPRPEGVELDPRLPQRRWTYETALIDVAWSPERIAVDHRAAEGGAKWRIRIPVEWGGACTPEGEPHPVAAGWATPALGAAVLVPCAP